MALGAVFYAHNVDDPLAGLMEKVSDKTRGLWAFLTRFFNTNIHHRRKT